MIKRPIVSIDPQKCDGCGQCIPGCEEGAIRIVDGKARLVSDAWCDGLGACLGHCPQGAITVVEREADPFDEAAVAAPRTALPAALPVIAHGGGCLGSRARSLELATKGRAAWTAESVAVEGNRPPSGLANWPVQLQLVPIAAPYLQGADLLLVADCVPLAMGDFHQRFLNGRPVVIGCPKLDDARHHVQKLAQIILAAEIRSITVVHMEVPCCTALGQIARGAAELARGNVPVDTVVVTTGGQPSVRGAQQAASADSLGPKHSAPG